MSMTKKILAGVSIVAALALAACGSANGQGQGVTPSVSTCTRATPATPPLTSLQAACRAGLNASRSLNVPLASHDAATVAAVADTATAALTAMSDAP
jgi:hypothetical protein